MAKLYFYYSSMNAGKSTALLQSSYNYRERGMNTLVLAPDFDDRYGVGKVTSRIGLETAATTFAVDADLFRLISKLFNDTPLHCVLIDEAQFLTKEQVFQLGEVTDVAQHTGAGLWASYRLSGRAIRRKQVPARLGRQPQ